MQSFLNPRHPKRTLTTSQATGTTSQVSESFGSLNSKLVAKRFCDGNQKCSLSSIPDIRSSARLRMSFTHGGAWRLNDKYSDMSYMRNTIKGFLDNGYALASIDCRHSTTAVFPAQVQHLNEGLQYLYDHADEYKLDKNKIALIGFSAGGHLASVLALSENNVKAFYKNGVKSKVTIKCVLDFYGPSDFIALATNPDTTINNATNPVLVLPGAMAIDRPDLAKAASPVTYIDKNDPPFFIVQGEKDESVPNTQSKLLSSWLTLSGVKNEFTMVPDAPHYGEMFDAEWIREKLLKFLAVNLRQ